MITKKVVEAEQDKEIAVIAVIQKQGGAIVQRAENFQVVSAKSFEESGGIIAWISKAKKKIEETRKFYTKPLNDQVAKINERFKGYSIPFDTADKIIRNKMLSYRQEQETIRQAEENKARIEAEKIAKKEKISVEEVMQSVEIKKVIKTTDNSTVKKIWTFEIIDMEKIPREYLVVGETIIRNAIREGTRTITGVRIYEKETISLR